MEYIEYFNLLNTGFKDFIDVIPGIIFMVIGIAGLVLVIKFRNKLTVAFFHWKLLLIFFSVWTVFTIFWTALVLPSTLGEYLTLRNVLISNEFKTVEGIVSNFHPMPYEGHEEETFTVQGIRFSYSDYIATNAFNNTKSHGGPIDEGKAVKIDYYNGKILRLWIKQ
jgi:hypothetical protein